MLEKEIKYSWELSYPVELVWNALTDPEMISRWLMETDFKPIVGHKFRFRTKPMKKFGFDGIIHCEVLEVKPFEKLSYSWQGGPGDGRFTLDSKVTWTLTPTEAGTDLLLKHTGFRGLRNYFAYIGMNKGWGSTIKQRFVELLETKENETAKS